MRLIADLFFTFARIGLFSFGGGYAMLPLIQRETAEKKRWVGEEDILEIAAVAEATPGPIAVNAATFIGYRTAGIAGAFSATLGVVLPSFCVILGLSYAVGIVQENRAVAYAFYGVRAAVLALIGKALWNAWKKTPKKAFSYVITAAVFLAVAVFRVGAVPVILCAAAAGLIWSLLAQKRWEK